jgi:C4-dicarboxylate-binding protein DctP
MTISAKIMVASIACFSWLASSCTQCGSDKSGAQVQVLRLGHDSSESSALHLATLEIAKEVALASNGELKIDVYPSQKLGTDPQMFEMARDGELDIALTPTSKITPMFPQLALLDLPFFYPDGASLNKMLDGPVGLKLFEPFAAKGLVGVAFWGMGAKQFTSDFEINSANDFVGKKMRVMGSQMLMQQFELLGAKPVVIDFFETRNALMNKQVDGQENPLSTILSMKFYEVQKHLTLSSHAYLTEAVLVSAKTMESLTPQHREILLSKIRSVTPRYRQLEEQESRSALEEIKKSPIQIHELSAAVREDMRKKMWDLTFATGDQIGPELMKIVYGELGIAAPRDVGLVIGLDADMTGPSALSGQAIERGLQLAIHEINDKGGITGKPLRLLVKDHQAVAARSSANIDELIQRGGVKAIFAGIQSGIISGVLPQIQKGGIPLLVSWATATALTENGFKPNPVFRLSAQDGAVGPFLAQAAMKKSKKIALVFENSVWGHGNELSITRELSKHNIKPVAAIYVNVGQKDLLDTVKAVEESRAEVMVMVMNAAEAKDYMMTTFARPRHMPIVSHWGVTGGTFGKDLAEQLQSYDFSFFQTNGFQGNPRKKSADLAKRYLTAYGGSEALDISAPAGVIRTYDMMMMLGEALIENEKNPKISVGDALEKIKEFDGAAASYSKPFANPLHEGFDPKFYTLGKFDNKGRIVPVGP